MLSLSSQAQSPVWEAGHEQFRTLAINTGNCVRTDEERGVHEARWGRGLPGRLPIELEA